jgi:hypothetical protein
MSLLDTLKIINILLGYLEAYIKKNNYFYRCYKKYKTGCFYDKFSFYRILVRTAIKTDSPGSNLSMKT